MSKSKNSFVMYGDYAQHFAKFSAEDGMALLMAIFKYHNTGEVSELPLGPDIAFGFIKDTMDRDAKSYAKVVERNRANGAKGGRPVQSLDKKDPSGLSGLEWVPKKPDSDTDNDTDTKKKKTPATRKKFVPPTLEEVRAECKRRKNSVNPEAFIAHYESNGWMVGKNKMKSWQHCIITWENNSFGKEKAPSSGNLFIVNGEN